MKYVELSHYVTDGLISYPGMPPVEISAFMTREECGAAFGTTGAAMLDQIKMVNISGTYIDAPYHRFESGYKIGDIPLEKLVNLDTFVVSMDKEKGYFDLEDLMDLDLLPDKGAQLYVIPIRVAMASFPARVFAILEDD